jgi:Cu/Ag efflux protein CusF
MPFLPFVLNQIVKKLFHRLFLSLTITLGVAGFAITLLPTISHAQSRQSFYAEIVKIDRATNKVTLKAVMGHKTLRVARPDILDGFKEGDQVIFETGQDGVEVIVTVLTSAKK